MLRLRPRRQGGASNAALLQAALEDVDLAYQNLESVELGVTTVDHYFDTLGGISRAVKPRPRRRRRRSISATRPAAKARSAPSPNRSRWRPARASLNPKWFEGLLKHGHEGVHQIEAQVTNTFGWSATTGQVEPWVYQRLTETFVLDEAMRRRLAGAEPGGQPAHGEPPARGARPRLLAARRGDASRRCATAPTNWRTGSKAIAGDRERNDRNL